MQDVNSGASKGSSSLVGMILAGICGIIIGVFGAMGLMKAKSGGGENPVVASYNGNKVKADEAYKSVKTRVFNLEQEMFRIKDRAIDDYIERALLKDESKKQNMTEQQLIEKEMGGKPTPVTDKDIEAFLTARGLKLDDPRIRKNDVKDYLTYQQVNNKRMAYVSKLKKTANVKKYLSEPAREKIKVTTEGYPRWGNSSAPVKIVEFSDYECPYCGNAVHVLNQIKKEYGPDKVQIVFKDMPLPSHSRAMPASLAALCVNEQDSSLFWKYHDKLFATQGEWRKVEVDKMGPALEKYVATIVKENEGSKIDMDAYKKCFDEKRHVKKIQDTQAEIGEKIRATPSFVINEDHLIQGAQPFNKFKEVIDKILNKS